MSNSNILVIGGGRLGTIHARLAQTLPNAELVGIVDPDPDAQQRLSQFNVPVVEHWEELAGEFQAAVIATPTVLHHAVAAPLLQEGIHLLIEKPITTTVMEATQLIQLAEQKELVLQVGHVERFNPALQAAKPFLRRPRYLQAARQSAYTCRSTDIGVVLDLMIHDIDIVLSLVDDEVVAVEATGSTVFGPHEDTAHARLKFRGGAVASLNASRVSPRACRTLEIQGESGQTFLDFGDHKVQHVGVSPAVAGGALDVAQLTAEQKDEIQKNLFSEYLPAGDLEIVSGNAILEEQADFVSAIQNNSQPQVTGRSGKAALEVAQAIVAQIQQCGWNCNSERDWETRRKAG